MARRQADAWIIVVVDPTVKRWSPTWKLARVVGTTTAARWRKVADAMSRPALRRRAEAAAREGPED